MKNIKLKLYFKMLIFVEILTIFICACCHLGYYLIGQDFYLALYWIIPIVVLFSCLLAIFVLIPIIKYFFAS